MKHFYCSCGHRVFFDNTTCLHCGAALGLDPAILDMRPLGAGGFRYCDNHERFGVCNWLVPEHEDQRWCQACRLNDLIPNLDVAGNLELWSRLERAKRRLLYTLISLGLPLHATGNAPELRFRFLEDRRRNPNVLEPFVTTGHVAGTVTINLAEADDATRHAAREQMRERYRTPLGHLRHECGHSYFDYLVRDAEERAAFRALFGDETADYETALERYYRDGAPADWAGRFVSAYAAAHPHEDWAETFAHYLHIVDALETAEAAGLARKRNGATPGWILEWMELAVTLNELNRSLGIDDPYPFVLTAPVIAKLEFINRLVRPPPGPVGACRVEPAAH